MFIEKDTKKMSVSSKNNILKRSLALLIAVKGTSVFYTLLIVPFLVTIMSTSTYGLWLVIFSVISWISIFDFGLGNGFRNLFIKAYESGDMKTATNLVYDLYSTTGLIILIIDMIFLIIWPFVNWSHIFNINSKFSENIDLIVLVVFLLFSIQLYSNNISTLLLSIQKSGLNSSIQLLSNILSGIAIFLVWQLNKVSLLVISVIFISSSIIINLIYTFFFFNKFFYNHNSVKKIRLPTKNSFKNLSNFGFDYFIIQIAMVVLFSTDNFLINYFYGSIDVTNYSFVYRVYFSILSLLLLFLNPFWSIITKAITEGDLVWVQRTMKSLLFTWVIFFFVVIVVSWNVEFILRIWLQKQIVVDWLLNLALLMYVLVLSWVNIIATYLNSVGVVKLQRNISLFQVLLNIPFCIFFSKYLNLGVAGIIIGSNIILFFGGILLTLKFRTHFKALVKN